MSEAAEDTAEIREPDTPAAPKKRLKVRWTDIVIFAVIIVVAGGMAVFILNKLNLKHEVSQARVVTDRVIADLAKQDTKSIWALGDKKFQTKNSPAELNTLLVATTPDGSKITFAQLYGDDKPTVDRQIVANNSRGQHVAIIYRYNKLKAPFFVRVDAEKLPGSTKWTLQGFSTSHDETSLLT